MLLWDERLSTAAVERTLIDADTSRAKRGAVIDKMAAAFILQGAGQIARLNPSKFTCHDSVLRLYNRVLMTSSALNFTFPFRDLLGIELSASDITNLLDLADTYVDLNRQIDKKTDVLRGRTQINLFFESSTRTQSSF